MRIRDGRTLVHSLVVWGALAGGPGLVAPEALASPPGDDAGEKVDLKKLGKQLERAIEFRNEVQIRAILTNMARANTVAAAKMIVAVTAQLYDYDLYDAVVPALASMTDPRTRAYFYKEMKSSRRWMTRYLLLSVVVRLDGDEAREALVQSASAEKNSRVFGHAVDLLAALRKPWAVDALIELLEETRKSRSRAVLAGLVLEALQQTTRKGIENATDWRNWWEGARAGFQFPDPGKEDEPSGVTTVIQRLKKRNEEHFLREIAKGDVLVVEGVFDQVQEVLEELKIPYELHKRSEVADIPLDPRSVLIFNCHDTNQDRIPGSTIKRINRFVRDGGYVFTSDWELQNVIQPGFPNTIGMSNLTQEQELKVKIRPSEENHDHPYLRDVFPKNPFKLKNYRWQIDGLSSTLRFGKGKVYPLVESSELEKKYGNPSVAVTFRHGKGSVLHVLSHFHAQRDADGDGFALQQLLANFIIEKQKWRRSQTEKKER